MLLNPYRFGVAAGGDPYWANVASLLHFEGVNGSTVFIDQKAKTWSATGDAAISIAQSRFGSSSYHGDGTGDLISTPLHADFAFGTGDLTIECALRMTTLPAANSSSSVAMYSQLESSVGLTWQYRTFPTTRFAIFLGQTEVASFATTLSANTWYRIALSRASGTMRAFVEGSKVGSDVASSHNFTASSRGPQIGGLNFSGIFGSLDGYIDEMRITKGVGRYTANYTPDSVPFPNY